MRTRLATSLLLATLALSALAVSPGAAGAGELQEGDIVRDHGLGVVVPPAGHAIHIEFLYVDGVEEFGVIHHSDGTVELEDVGNERATPSVLEPLAPAGTPLGACEDTAYTAADERWYTRFEWFFNRSTTPGEVTADQAESAMIRASNNIVRADNDCGMPDNVSATHTYRGSTTERTGITPGGLCGPVDLVSVVDFGDLPLGVLAGECTFKLLNPGGDDVMLESDVAFNKQNYNWTTTPGSDSCRNAYDIEGVMTHERGHTFGLGHVGEQLHGKLTMSTHNNGACQLSERTLGRGDVRGLESKY